MHTESCKSLILRLIPRHTENAQAFSVCLGIFFHQHIFPIYNYRYLTLIFFSL